METSSLKYQCLYYFLIENFTTCNIINISKNFYTLGKDSVKNNTMFPTFKIVYKIINN